MSDAPKELERAKKILGQRFCNFLIIAEDAETEFTDYSSETSAYGLAAKFVCKCENSWRDDGEIEEEEE